MWFKTVTCHLSFWPDLCLTEFRIWKTNPTRSWRDSYFSVSSNQPPPINQNLPQAMHTAYPLVTKYYSYNDYLQIMVPLIMMEIWEMVGYLFCKRHLYSILLLFSIWQSWKIFYDILKWIGSNISLMVYSHWRIQGGYLLFTLQFGLNFMFSRHFSRPLAKKFWDWAGCPQMRNPGSAIGSFTFSSFVQRGNYGQKPGEDCRSCRVR